MAQIRKFIGAMCILAGCAMIGKCALMLWENEQNSRAAEEAAAETMPLLLDAIAEGAANTDSALVQQYLLGDAYTPELAEDDSGTGFVIPVNGYNYIGYITVPSVGMELPVLDGWDDVRLNLAPCRYYGSAKGGNLVIAGHNYRNSFGKCHSIRAGDVAYFTDAANITHTYAVADVEILNPTDVPEMVESGYDLSLYTCTLGGKQRLTVRCCEIPDEAEETMPASAF